eukprot:TRINITY_DN9591_c0_g1_i3.p1 TRINITY_DN9591_c0_g1~~TRINITY_DN9591_c0_g1_i3.p1  ORF type:complete len:538 (+),score=125.89 TRINITY_DN9591_c0_g1_i3:37-1614(+)
MASKQVLQVFESYQKSRTTFVQTIAELSSRSQNVEALKQAGVMSLLRPLLIDTVPTIQQSAALALGRLANHSDELAAAVVTDDILPQLVYGLAEQNRFYKKAAAFVLRTVAKHSPELAQSVVDSGAVDALVICLDEFDPSVKEAAAWALGYIARHNADLAQAVVDAGAVPLLILCVQEPEIALKRIAASALSDISKHSPELAQTVVDGGAISYLAQLLDVQDAKLKRQVFSALSQIAKHTVDLAELVVEAYIFPAVLPSLQDPDEYVRKNVATLVRDVAKHSAELAQLIVNSGGVISVVDYVNESSGSALMPAVMALGYIAAFSERLAMSVIVSHGVTALASVLHNEGEDHVRAAAAWSLGQTGRHTASHAQKVAEAGVLPDLLELTIDAEANVDLKAKASRALRNVLQKCTYLPALQSLLSQAPAEILENVVGQFAKILPTDAKARKQFVTSGGLKKIQEIKTEPESELADAILTINECFPEEIVRYYSPGKDNAPCNMNNKLCKSWSPFAANTLSCLQCMFHA